MRKGVVAIAIGVDVSSFHPYNVTDTCAVWNVLSSQLLFEAAKKARVQFICAEFVLYECLQKPRTSVSEPETELQRRLVGARRRGDFVPCPLDISDLQVVQILNNRKRLGKGELASAALAYKIRQALLTDDQPARRLVRNALPDVTVQTTPHLLGWLVYCGAIDDSEEDTVVMEHEAVNRPLTEFLHDMCTEARRCRALSPYGPA